ncbi:MAG TPA: hypothetical protein VFV81_09345 [Verrucomicrobiae bacterium]|nr:hypothetical protein [Verrucomicrobiae bacterium]
MSLSASLFGAELQIRFDQYAAGETPTNFHRALAGGGEPGVWKIVTDVVPPTLAPLTDKVVIPPRPVLAQLSTDPTDERFPMFVYDGQKFKDFKFTTRFKIISGVAEQMAGVVFRYQNASNFYVLRASALGENFRFYKVVNGIRSDPIGPKVMISTNVWHSLAVQCQGNQIICWLDGALAMPPLNDNTFTVGKIGFWTMSDAVSYFADPVVDYKPLIPAAQTLVNNIMEREPRILELRIYRLDDQGKPKIIASNKPGEVGQPGGDYEHNAIVNGKIFIGHGKGTVSFSMPYRDRNGDPIAAVRIGLKSSFTETQDMAVSRATAILRMMEQQIDNAKDLSQ